MTPERPPVKDCFCKPKDEDVFRKYGHETLAQLLDPEAEQEIYRIAKILARERSSDQFRQSAIIAFGDIGLEHTPPRFVVPCQIRKEDEIIATPAAKIVEAIHNSKDQVMIIAADGMVAETARSLKPDPQKRTINGELPASWHNLFDLDVYLLTRRALTLKDILTSLKSDPKLSEEIKTSLAVKTSSWKPGFSRLSSPWVDLTLGRNGPFYGPEYKLPHLIRSGIVDLAFLLPLNGQIHAVRIIPSLKHNRYQRINLEPTAREETPRRALPIILHWLDWAFPSAKEYLTHGIYNACHWQRRISANVYCLLGDYKESPIPWGEFLFRPENHHEEIKEHVICTARSIAERTFYKFAENAREAITAIAGGNPKLAREIAEKIFCHCLESLKSIAADPERGFYAYLAPENFCFMTAGLGMISEKGLFSRWAAFLKENSRLEKLTARLRYCRKGPQSLAQAFVYYFMYNEARGDWQELVSIFTPPCLEKWLDPELVKTTICKEIIKIKPDCYQQKRQILFPS